MAGTLLLIKKKEVSTKDFNTLSENLKTKTLLYYKKYFKSIDCYANDESLWITFYKDDSTKVYADNEGNRLTYEGVVFALNETKRLSADDLWQRYKTDSNFINTLDGQFVIKIYDRSKNEYHIFSDIIKSHTNYYTESEKGLLFTPFALTATGITTPTLDIKAFNEYMWRYYIISNRTLLKDVSRLSPASHYSFSNNKLNISTYWQWPKTYTDKPLKECIALASKNMKETARLIDSSFPDPCIDFTMGQDSRQVVAAFKSQGLKFNTSLFGKREFYEVRAVTQMSERHNIDFNNIQLDDDFASNFHTYLEEITRISSAEEPVYLLARLNNMRAQQMKLSTTAMNGCDGHFYKNGLWDEMYTFNLYKEPKKFNFDLFIKMRALSKNYPDSMFNAQLKAVKTKSKEYYKEIISKAIEGYEKSPVSMQVDRFDLYHWLNFLLAATQSANKQGQLFAPLLFRRNLELALTVPVKWKWNLSDFQRGIVWDLSPDLAKEKTDFGGVSMKPLNPLTRIPFLVRYFWFQSKRLRNKIKTKLGFKVITHLQEAWDYLPIYREALKNKEINDLLHGDWAIKEILDEKGFKQYLTKFKEPNKCSLADFEHLYKMLTVEHFIKESKEFATSE